jgi:hypothetical protein
MKVAYILAIGVIAAGAVSVSAAEASIAAGDTITVTTNGGTPQTLTYPGSGSTDLNTAFGSFLLDFTISNDQIILTEDASNGAYGNGMHPNTLVFEDTTADPLINSVTLASENSTRPGFDILPDTSFGSNSVTFTFKAQDVASGSVFTYDLSYVQAVPEPSTWALLIAGLGGAGLALRSARRRRGLAAA